MRRLFRQHTEQILAIGLVVVALLLGAAFRIWIAIHDQGMYWPDEIYQSLEPAHKLAFGYGILPWEYIQGARSWLLPGIFAVVFKLSAHVGAVAPWQYLALIRSVLIINALFTIIGVYLLALRYRAQALIAAGATALFAAWPIAIFFSFRALSEVASTGVITFGFLSISYATNKRWLPGVIGISLLMISVFFRLQSGIFLLGALGLLAWQLPVRRWWIPATTTLIWVGLFGLFDKLTWGSWFHSAVTYYTYNVTNHGSLGFGIAPVSYYVNTLSNNLSGVWIAFGLLTLLSAKRAGGLFLIVCTYLLIHSLIPHKEVRFIYPDLPLMFVLLAVGGSQLADWFRHWSARYILGGALLCISATFALRPFTVSPNLVEQQLFDGQTTSTSAYGQYSNENKLLWAAFTQPDLCGLRLDSVWVVTGGYTYLHRNVPIVQSIDAVGGTYNYEITSDPFLNNPTVATAGNERLIVVSGQGCTTK